MAGKDKSGESKGSSVKFLLAFHSPYLVSNWKNQFPHSPAQRTCNKWRFSSHGKARLS